MYPNKPNQNRKPSNSEIKIAQMQYVVGEITKRLQGLIYGFDSYVKMKGDDENLNKYIKDNIEKRKKENAKNESTRGDSKSSNRKSVGNVS